MTKVEKVEKVAKTTVESGIAKLSSFSYKKGWIAFMLDNGVSGIIGSSDDIPFATLITMKQAAISYVHKGQRTDKNGKVHESYELGFSMV